MVRNEELSSSPVSSQYKITNKIVGIYPNIPTLSTRKCTGEMGNWENENWEQVCRRLPSATLVESVTASHLMMRSPTVCILYLLYLYFHAVRQNEWTRGRHSTCLGNLSSCLARPLLSHLLNLLTCSELRVENWELSWESSTTTHFSFSNFSILNAIRKMGKS